MSSTPAVETDDTALIDGSAFPRELLFKFLVVGDYGVGKETFVPLISLPHCNPIAIHMDVKQQLFHVIYKKVDGVYFNGIHCSD
jgi:hypothetical protein